MNHDIILIIIKYQNILIFYFYIASCSSGWRKIVPESECWTFLDGGWLKLPKACN